MAVEGDKPPKPDDEPDYKKWGVIVGTISAVFAILAAVNSLTGFNPLKELGPSSSRTPTPTSAPRLAAPTTEAKPTYRPPRTTEVAAERTESTRRAAPEFRLRSAQWTGPCQETACSMSAIFRNYGGEGTGSATFYVLRPDKYEYLAKCSVVLSRTAENDLTDEGCTASSVQLQSWIRSHPGGTVRMEVKVDG